MMCVCHSHHDIWDCCSSRLYIRCIRCNICMHGTSLKRIWKNGWCGPVCGGWPETFSRKGHHNWSRRDPSCAKGSAGERAYDSGCRGCEAPPLVREIRDTWEARGLVLLHWRNVAPRILSVLLFLSAHQSTLLGGTFMLILCRNRELDWGRRVFFKSEPWGCWGSYARPVRRLTL